MDDDDHPFRPTYAPTSEAIDHLSVARSDLFEAAAAVTGARNNVIRSQPFSLEGAIACAEDALRHLDAIVIASTRV